MLRRAAAAGVAAVVGSVAVGNVVVAKGYERTPAVDDAPHERRDTRGYVFS